jgi:hypothetical protein
VGASRDTSLQRSSVVPRLPRLLGLPGGLKRPRSAPTTAYPAMGNRPSPQGLRLDQPSLLDTGRSRSLRPVDSDERGMSNPGLLATRIARGAVVPAGHDARPSRANVRHPATAQVQAVQPFVLDGLPGTTPRRPQSVAGEGRAFGACCCAGKLRSPAGPGPVPRWPRALTPTRNPTLDPTPATRVPPSPAGGRIAAGDAPSGEWSGRAEWCASRD